MTGRAEIAAIVILATCPCGTIHADEIDMEQDDFGAWKAPDDERFILCDECGQLFDAGVEISLQQMAEVPE